MFEQQKSIWIVEPACDARRYVTDERDIAGSHIDPVRRNGYLLSLRDFFFKKKKFNMSLGDYYQGYIQVRIM